jgi:partner of Y14 and mago protein
LIYILVQIIQVPSLTMSNVAKSGITTDAKTGERYIPSSVRPDGSKRKEIRVRPGYKPPEDVELYKNRAAAAWKTRAKGGVPGAEALSSEEDKIKAAPRPAPAATAAAVPATAASNKNAKRREAKRNAKDTDGVEGKGIDSNNWRAPLTPAPAPKEEKPVQEPFDVEAEKEKKARNLKKKLRQARDLRDKKEQGEGLLPEQLDKIIKIQELVRQLDVLGFDSNGEKKTGKSSEDA